MDNMRAILNERIDDGHGIIKRKKRIFCHCCQTQSSSYCIMDRMCELDNIILCKSCLTKAVSIIDKAIINSIK